MLKRIFAITKARTLEFLRDYANVAFTFFLPFCLIAGFKYAYSDNEVIFRIGYIDELPELHTEISEIEWKRMDLPEAQKKLQFQRIDLIVDQARSAIWFNPKSSRSKLIFKLLDADKLAKFSRSPLEGKATRYIDWLFPGILAMNIMFACLNGIGYVIVRYRINGVLKRYLATPMSASEFLIGQMASRFLIVLFVNLILYSGCVWLFDLLAVGSHALVFLITIAGSFNMMAIGLLMASRTKSEEVAASLLNVVAMPMMFVSGTWFAVDDLNPALLKVVEFIPMTHLNDSLRAVMLEGASLMQVLPELTYLFASGVIILVFSSLIFRWSDS